jgi:hypothetical protein
MKYGKEDSVKIGRGIFSRTISMLEPEAIAEVSKP